MMEHPIQNPQIPYVGPIQGGLQPGKMVRIQGVAAPNGDRFDINFQSGPNVQHSGAEIGLHMSVRLNQGYIARNSYQMGGWGEEMGDGTLPIGHGQQFEVLILSDLHDFKVAVNGQHFCLFPYRMPKERLSHLSIMGDVNVTLISWEMTMTPPPSGGGAMYGPSAPPMGGGDESYSSPSTTNSFFDHAQKALMGAIAGAAANKLLGGVLGGGYAPQNAQYGQYPQMPGGGGGSMGSVLLSSLMGGGSSNRQQQQSGDPLGGFLSSLVSGGGGGPPQDRHQQGGGANLGNFLGSLLGPKDRRY